MNTVILIGGFPGVGKSTIATRLATELSGEVLDIDVFKKLAADPNRVKNEIDPPEVRRLYYKMALEAAFKRFSSGVPVITMEEIFHLAPLRKEMTETCRVKDIKVQWIEVYCPFNIVKARLESNGRNGHILSTGEALRMYQMFEKVFDPFGPDEDYLSINNSGTQLDLDAEIGRVLNLNLV